jgi:HK97 family phage prohead protease
MLTRKTLAFSDCGIKFAGERPESSFSGYASTFNGVDSYNDRIAPGAYDSVIKSIAAGAARMPKMFVNHKAWELPIGKWLDLYQDGIGLKVEGELTPGNPNAAAVRASMEHGTVDGLSIGFRLLKGDTEMVQEKGAEIRLIKNISELVEISVVTFPADEDARVDLTSLKFAVETIETIRDLEAFLRDAGLPRSLAKATAGQAKRIFDRRDVGETVCLSEDLRCLIYSTLKDSKSLSKELSQ